MTSSTDQEITKAFQDLQQTKTYTKQRIDVLTNQIASLKNFINYNGYVNMELEKTPETVVLYESIGRMFVHKDHESIKHTVKTKMEDYEKLIKSCEESMTVLQKSLKEQETSVREMVNQIRKN